MSPDATPTEPKLSPAEQRAREKAEWAEHDALIKRLGQLWPNYGCFCGTLEDLRRTVADLERRAERTPPQRSATRADKGSRDSEPQTAARLAVARAQQRLQRSDEGGHADPGAHANQSLRHAEAAGEADD